MIATILFQVAVLALGLVGGIMAAKALEADYLDKKAKRPSRRQGASGRPHAAGG